MVQGAFNQVNENDGFQGQTKPLKKADCQGVANVVAVLLGHFLDPGEWKYKAHKGSVTLSKKKEPKKSPFVTVFVDYGNSLASRCQIRVSQDPMVVGLELTNLPPFTRHSIRNQLAKDFQFYADPRVPGCPKVSFKPKNSHLYDLVFLERGSCEYEVPAQLMDEVEASVREKAVAD